MYAKIKEKQKAIEMRIAGKVYSEILAVVPVAKSTLSIWLREVGLAKAQKQRITKRRIAAQKMGAQARRDKRIVDQQRIWKNAKADIGDISDRELFLIGVALYWAEGSKEKSWKPGSQVKFSNMDQTMIRVFLLWLHRIVKVPKDMLLFEITLHENHTFRVPEVIAYWKKVTGFRQGSAFKVYFKKSKILTTKRRNVGVETYFGILRVRVKQSSILLRNITGWTMGITEVLTK